MWSPWFSLPTLTMANFSTAAVITCGLQFPTLQKCTGLWEACAFPCCFVNGLSTVSLVCVRWGRRIQHWKLCCNLHLKEIYSVSRECVWSTYKRRDGLGRISRIYCKLSWKWSLYLFHRICVAEWETHALWPRPIMFPIEWSFLKDH